MTPQRVATPPATRCEPILEVHTEIVAVPAELTEIHPNPTVPSMGDNAALLDWAQSCAINNRAYEAQMEGLKDLK